MDSVTLAQCEPVGIYYTYRTFPGKATLINFQGHCIEKNIILLCVRWYLVCPLGYRNLEEMLEERGVQVVHSNIYRWVQKFTPHLEAAFNGKKRPVGSAWRVEVAVSGSRQRGSDH
jgi:transposase-like protein